MTATGVIPCPLKDSCFAWQDSAQRQELSAIADARGSIQNRDLGISKSIPFRLTAFPEISIEFFHEQTGRCVFHFPETTDDGVGTGGEKSAGQWDQDLVPAPALTSGVDSSE